MRDVGPKEDGLAGAETVVAQHEGPHDDATVARELCLESLRECERIVEQPAALWREESGDKAKVWKEKEGQATRTSTVLSTG